MKLKIRAAAFIVIGASVFLGVKSSEAEKGTSGALRYRFKAVKINTKGRCPDSIAATVLDSKTGEIIPYKVKASLNGKTGDYYYTFEADKKGSLIAGQIMDCSLSTVATLINTDNLKKPYLVFSK